MTKISAGTTLTTIVGTEVAPVFKVGQTSGQKFVMPMALIGPNAKASITYDGHVAYCVEPIETTGNGQANLEIMNIGNPGSNSENRNLVPAGIYRHTGSIVVGRNMEWDNSNQRWITPYQQANAYGASCFEAGGEAAILHATPAGVDFYSVPHEILLAKASGTDAEQVADRVSSGYYTQSKATIFARFSSEAYNTTTTANSWNDPTGAVPLLWLSSREAKTTENEFVRLETNADSSTAWPSLYFAKSRGTLAAKTTVVTGERMGRIAWKAYDGDEYHITAAIETWSYGTIANNTVPQRIKFLTSATNTAGLVTRWEIVGNSLRQEVSSISTIPAYSSFAGFSPTNSTACVGAIQEASSSTGGMGIYGLSTTSTANTAIPLFLRGILGATSPTAPAIVFIASKNDGANSIGALAATEILCQFRNSSSSNIVLEMLASGNTGFGVTTPTAVAHLSAVTTTRASLCIAAGATTTAPSSPVSGDVWHQGTNNRLMFRKGASSQEIMCSVQVNSVSPTAPDRTIEITIDGTTYYIHAKTTND